MSLAFRARASSACAGAFAAFAAATVVRHADARASGDVLGARARWEEAEGAACERGEAVFGRAVRREIGRGWNAGVDAVFGAGVRALSERRL
tara:strand:+ start:13775 stop:14050 length:276 start_codon:yes stop_codon:yes gene_type:complete